MVLVQFISKLQNHRNYNWGRPPLPAPAIGPGAAAGRAIRCYSSGAAARPAAPCGVSAAIPGPYLRMHPGIRTGTKVRTCVHTHTCTTSTIPNLSSPIPNLNSPIPNYNSPIPNLNSPTSSSSGLKFVK
jgi:hypothetical protein